MPRKPADAHPEIPRAAGAPPATLQLEDVLGDVPRSYPVAFYPEPVDEDAEREALDRQIYSRLIIV